MAFYCEATNPDGETEVFYADNMTALHGAMQRYWNEGFRTFFTDWQD